MLFKLNPNNYFKRDVPRVDAWHPPKDAPVKCFSVSANKTVKGMAYDFRKMVSHSTISALEKATGEEDKEGIGFGRFIITRQAYSKDLGVLGFYAKYINFFIEYHDYDNEYLMGAMKMKYNIDDKVEVPYYPLHVFRSDCVDAFLTTTMRGKIRQMVDEQYNVNVEKGEGSYSERCEAVGFTNEHAKELMEISIAIKLMIPIINHYFAVRADAMRDFAKQNGLGDKVLKDVFIFNHMMSYLFEIMPQSNLYNKLYSMALTYFRHQDKSMVLRAEARTVTQATRFSDAMSQVTTEIVPKYNFRDNCISMNHVSIRSNMQREFNTKETYLYYEPGYSSSNDEPSGLEMLESAHANMIDLDFAINTANIIGTIDKLCKTYNVEITTEELEFYRDNLINTRFINKIVEFFISYFGGPFDLMNIKQADSAKLVVLFKVIMEKHGFIYLQHLLTGSVAKNGKLSGRKLSKARYLRLLDDAKYKRLMKQYSMTMDPEDNHIIDILSQLTNTPITMVDYRNENSGQVIIPDDDLVQDEYLRFEQML